MSESWGQDYSSPATERCYVGRAPESAGPFRQYCDAHGRFVRIVLPGETRNLSLARVGDLLSNCSSDFILAPLAVNAIVGSFGRSRSSE